jgi:zinc transport system permease protein
VGLIFIALTPGYIDPMSYLFGNILLVTRSDLWWVLALDLVVVSAGLLFYNKLLAVCFEEEFARLRGIRVEAYYLFLLVLTALTVVLLVRVVGIVMVIALLTLPAAVAGVLTRKLWQMMLVAIMACMLFIISGIGISYIHDIPSGPVIIILAGLAYIFVMLGSGLAKKLRHMN